MKITSFRRNQSLYPPFGLSHKHRDGKLVLKGEASWRTVNGFYVTIHRLKRQWWIEFR